MSQWIRTDHDFGLPAIQFIISVRQVMIASHQGKPDLRKLLQSDNPELMAKELVDYITHFYPSLGDGKGAVVGIRLIGGLTWYIDYYHPKLKRVKMGEFPPVVSLLDRDEKLLPLIDEKEDKIEIPGPHLVNNVEPIVGWENRHAR